MALVAGGAPLPVTTDGQGVIEGRVAAVPVYVVSGGQAPLGQRARRVVVVTSGPIEGGTPIPVIDAGPGALVSAEAALPVYIVGAANLWPLAYTSKLIALNPIAYWPLAESSGAVVRDESGNGRNGTYTAVTLGAPGIGDGRTAATFDGTTSKANVFGASLASAFNGPAGTLHAVAKVSGAGVWSDATNRYLVELNADASNRVSILRSTSNGVITLAYRAGGTLKQVNTAVQSSLNYLYFTLTWDKAADQVKAYLNGSQIGSTQTALGTWAGALAVAMIGAQTAAPTAVWSGGAAHVALWNTALTPAQIASLATV